MLGVCMALIDDEKDKKAFEKLYNKYKNKVHAISLNILKNEQLAEESTSDTFLSLAKCFQKIKHFNSPFNLSYVKNKLLSQNVIFIIN